MTEESLFHDALARPAAQRPAFLDQACAEQPRLRAAVEALLAAHAASGSLLDRPPGDLAQAGSCATGDFTPRPAETPSRLVTTTTYHPNIEPGTVIGGRYTLVEKIGEGGMGEVWVAKQTEPVKRKVALKLIKTGMDSKAVFARFEQERQALALMDHPNIARVLDGGLTPAGQPFFVMELVNGLALTKFCDEARLTPKERLELFVPICQAVQHAHQKGIVHRDLKPSNILVTLIDGKPVPRVIDFGLAKATGGKLTDESLSTQFGAVVGTLEYMSPEQAGFSGVDVDTRADIYSLGVLLYELLTGLRPIDARRVKQAAFTEMLRIIKEEEPSRPSTRLSTDAGLPSLAAARRTEPRKLLALLRGELDWVVMKCLEKSRERRYETANGLTRDIQRYLADEPVEAGPPSASYRLGKFLKRHKGPMVAVGVVLAAVVVGMVGTSLGLLRAWQAEGVARQRYQEAEAERARAAALAVTEAEQRQKAEKAEGVAQQRYHEAEAERAKAAASALREAEQRQKAEKAEADTLADYRASTDDAIEQLLGSKAELGPKEKTYLENTLKRWQAFAARQGDDQRGRAIRAEGHFRVAFLWKTLGRLEEARANYQTARDLQKQLVAQFPDVRKYQQNLAGTRTNLGILLAGLGELEQALAEFQAARELLKPLVAQFPAVPEYQGQLASTRINLGTLLGDLGELEEARAEYQAARDLGKKLVAQFPAVPQYQTDLATTHNNLGGLLAHLGAPEEARAEYQAARDLGKKLVAQFPAVPQYQTDLATTHNNLGKLLKNLGQVEEARVAFQAARDLQKQLVAQFPAVPEYQQDLATTHNNLGNLLTDLGAPEEARAEYQAARDLGKKLVAQFPAVPQYQTDLATTHNNLGKLLTDLGEREEARAEYDVALNLKKQLVERFPAVPKYQIELGGSYCDYGNLIRAEGQATESLTWFDLAIQTLKSVHEKEPRDVSAKRFLRNSHLGRARAYAQLKKPAQAVKDWDRVIELSAPPERTGFRASRASSQVQAGQVAEAVAEVEELTRLPNWNAGQWYDCACVYAVASGNSADQKQAYADRAMELLQKAVKAGYKDAAHMVKDTDLDALRDRADFKQLLAELEKKPAPQAEKQP